MKAAIIGLGLIGASFGAALRRVAGYDQVLGWDQNPQAGQDALARDCITALADTREAAVADADLVVLAIYVGGILETLPAIAPLLKPGCTVLDVGSTKARIVEQMNQLPEQIIAVGGHPMTGRMTTGIHEADASLFAGRIFVLTPTLRSDAHALEAASALLRQIGAEPLIMEAEQHDRLVAIVSHLSRLIPIALLSVTRAESDDRVWKLAAGGFRESTRPASQDLGFWADVFSTNSQGIPQALRALSQELENLATAVETGDMDALQRANDLARADWLRRYGSQDG